jgi:hypothetical protein
MSKSARDVQKNKPTAVRSIAESIHDLAGAVLFEAGFKNAVLDREELVGLASIKWTEKLGHLVSCL